MLILLTALVLGAIYALVAVSFNAIFVATGVFNFAQPQYLMLGAFMGYFIITELGLHPVVAVLVGLALGALVGMLEELIAVRPLAGSTSHGELVTTVGWSVVLQGLVLLIWSADPLPVHGFGSDQIVRLPGATISMSEIVLVLLGITLPLGLHFWSRRSILGLASLAASEDRAAAMTRGVNVHRLSIMTFALACGLLAAIGPIAATKTFAIYSLGTLLVLKAFVAMSVGGFGSYIGVAIGGFLVGLTEAYSGRYLGAEFVNLVLFGLLIIVLMVRPSGLFATHTERVV